MSTFHHTSFDLVDKNKRWLASDNNGDAFPGPTKAELCLIKFSTVQTSKSKPIECVQNSLIKFVSNKIRMIKILIARFADFV